MGKPKSDSRMQRTNKLFIATPRKVLGQSASDSPKCSSGEFASKVAGEVATRSRYAGAGVSWVAQTRPLGFKLTYLRPRVFSWFLLPSGCHVPIQWFAHGIH